MISLSFSPAFIWGIPGFLFESGVKRCADSIASDAAARSHHPERESLEELKARGYNIQVNHAVFDHRGGVVVHFDVSHPRHHVIHTERFFRFTIEGKLDKSFSTPGNIPRYEHVLPLPDGRFLFYPDRGENGELPALMQDKGKDLRVTIRGAWELKVPRVIGGNTILGIDGVSLVRIRLPDPMRDGVRLEAERIVTMKDGIVPGHHVDSFTFRPAADGRILLALDMDNDDPSKPGMTLLANFSPSGRLLSKRVASGIFVHDFDYGACIDPAGGLLYVRDPGGGVFIARIRPDGREDAAFNGRFIATCGYFYMIMSVASDREGRILVTGRASPGNKPTVLLVDRGGRKIRTIYGD